VKSSGGCAAIDGGINSPGRLSTDRAKHKGGHADEYPDPAQTPDPNIDKPTLPPTEPAAPPEEDPPQDPPVRVEEPLAQGYPLTITRR